MSRLRNDFVLTIALGTLVLGGCYDDDTAPIDGTDPNCFGHSSLCPDDDPIDLPEGGEIRVELVNGREGEGFEVRTDAWFATAQTPESRPMTRPAREWNTTVPVDSTNPFGVCADMRSKTLFPNGLPTSRTYTDVGDTITLTSGTTEFVLDRYADLEDQAFDNIYDIGYMADLDPSDILTDTEYSVTVPGTGDFDAATFDDPALYMPPDFDVTYPDMLETVLLPVGNDFPVTWSDTSDTEDGNLYGFVAIGDALGVNFFCIGPRTGVMKIPEEVIEEIPSAGWFQVGLLSHRPIANSPTEGEDARRIDLLGISCQESDYTRVAL